MAFGHGGAVYVDEPLRPVATHAASVPHQAVGRVEQRGQGDVGTHDVGGQAVQWTLLETPLTLAL
jgi:hypothetical protein